MRDYDSIDPLEALKKQQQAEALKKYANLYGSAGQGFSPEEFKDYQSEDPNYQLTPMDSPVAPVNPVAPRPGPVASGQEYGKMLEQDNLLSMLRQQGGFSPNPEFNAPNEPVGNREIAGIPQAPAKSPVKTAKAPSDLSSFQNMVSEPSAPKEDLVAQLRSAQEAVGSNQLGAGIQRGGAQIGAAIAGIKPDYTNIEAQEKDAKAPVQRLEEKLKVSDQQEKLNDAKEMSDPNSNTSKMLRKFAEKFGMKLPDNVAGKHIEKVAPYIVNAFNAEESRKTRLEIEKDKNETRKLAAEAAGTEKKNKALDSEVGKLRETLDPNKMRGGNLAKSQAMKNAAERIEALLQQFPDGNVPKAQTTEVATAVAALISGGNPQSQHQIDSIVPDSMRGNAQDIASWFTNNPLGREQQAFIKLLGHTTAREKEVAERQIKEAQIAKLGGFTKLKEGDPERYKSTLSGFGINEEDVIDGKYISPKIKQQIQIFKANNPGVSDQEAFKALKSAGYVK